MKKFIDRIYFTVKSGKGGDGAVSFERYKYKRIGKPDGGDGGKGGDIIFIVDKQFSDLSHLIHKNIIKAKNGKNGAGQNKHGKDGEDVIIAVPPGTIIKNFENGKVIKELLIENEKYILLKGGRGGKGNAAFKSPTNRSPRKFEYGQKGKELKIILELKLLADVGLIGFPNAGKSTILKKITSAQPKIADYPFTTLTPNIGIFYDNTHNPYSIADIPGLIEGASNGKGLGFYFLRHIERTKILAIVLDISEKNFNNKFKILIEEMRKYNPALLKKKIFIVGNKIDIIKDKDNLNSISLPYDIIFISALKEINLDKLKKKIISLLKTL